MREEADGGGEVITALKVWARENVSAGFYDCVARRFVGVT